jgi:hypothetical protein
MKKEENSPERQWRLAQTNRFRRFCQSQGADPMAVMSGDEQIDISPILDEAGRIAPEEEDIDVARADSSTMIAEGQ